jgi:hypothetical protein
MINFTWTPNLETNRLILRKMEIRDTQSHFPWIEESEKFTDFIKEFLIK